MTISEAFDMYIRDQIIFIGQSKKTEEAYVAAKKVLLSRFGDLDICDLDFRHVREWKLWLEKGRSPNTIRNYVITLRVVLRFLKRRGYNVMDADSIPTPKRRHVDVSYLTDEEIEQLVIAVGRKRRGYFNENRLRNIALVKLLAATGLRNAELCSLNVNSIKENTFTVVGKGNKPRVCFVHDDAIAAVKTYLKMRSHTSQALFITKTGKRMNTGDVRRVFEFIRKNYPEFSEVHPHTLRHSYATSMLKKRVDIRYVKEFMGHESLNTTAHYTHVVNEDLRDIYLTAQK